MLADVTNVSRGGRGFSLADGTTHVVEPGHTARLDLADHALHGVWAAAGEVAIAAVGAADERQPFSRVREKVDRRSRAG